MATPKARRVFELLLIGWILPAIFGLYFGFKPEHWVARLSEYFALPLGILFVIVWLATYPELLACSWLKRFLKGIALFAMLSAFAWGGIRVGWPWVYTWLQSDTVTLQLVVVSKGDGQFRWRDRCERYHLRLLQVETKESWTFCSDEQIWKNFPVGQKARTERRSSALGSYVISIEKIE